MLDVFFFFSRYSFFLGYYLSFKLSLMIGLIERGEKHVWGKKKKRSP